MWIFVLECYFIFWSLMIAQDDIVFSLLMRLHLPGEIHATQRHNSHQVGIKADWEKTLH